MSGPLTSLGPAGVPPEIDLGAVHPATVRAFDEASGLGELSVTVGERACDVAFHCTAIADGTRTIEVGVLVTATLVAGRNGGVEAASLLRHPV